MKARSIGLAVVLALPAGACATQWHPRTAAPPTALQWPFAPAPAKVVLVRSISGFSRGKSAGGALRVVAYGRSGGDDDGFALPVAVAATADGRIAVADTGRACVHLYLPLEQRYVRLTGTRQERIASPVAVAFDEKARLFVSDSAGRLFAFAPDGAFLFSRTRVGEARLERPTGLAYSPATGLLYVVDTLGNRVHAVNGDGTLAFSFGQRGSGPGEFNYPTHIFRNPSGEIYVADSLNFRVEIFDEHGRFLDSFGHHGDGSGDLAMPKGLAVDKDGVVYVVDGRFDNVQLFSRRGDFLLTVGGSGREWGEFWLPSGAFIADSGELFVCDTYNRRVQVFRITEGYVADAR